MNVFKKSLFWLLLFVGGYSCFAQEISIRGGLNLSQMQITWDDFDVDKDTRLNPGFQLGPIIEIPVNKLLSFESGLFYSTKGLTEISKQTVNTKSMYKLNIAYFDVPMTVKISIPLKNLRLFANGGGYLAQGLFGNILSKEDINNSKREYQKVSWGTQENSFRRFDFGLKFGFGMKYEDLQLGICYENGIANLAGFERSKTKAKNKVASLYLSYSVWDKSKTKH